MPFERRLHQQAGLALATGTTVRFVVRADEDVVERKTLLEQHVHPVQFTSISEAVRAPPRSPRIRRATVGIPGGHARLWPGSRRRLSQKIHRTSCAIIEHKDGRSAGGTKKAGKPPSQAGPPQHSHLQKCERAREGHEKSAPERSAGGFHWIRSFAERTRLSISLTIGAARAIAACSVWPG